MAKFCENCGAKLDEDAQFCEDCGHAAEAVQAGSAQAQPQPPPTVRQDVDIPAVPPRPAAPPPPVAPPRPVPPPVQPMHLAQAGSPKKRHISIYR